MKTNEEQPSTVVNASGLILGRMASIVAKRLLSGEPIAIVNSEKAAMSGKRLSRLREARAFLEIGHPKKGPFHPRRPDQFVHKTIKGMLPRRQPKGQMALRRLRVFIGVPEEFKSVSFQTIPQAHVSRLKGPYITVGEIAKEIGYRSFGE